MKIFILGAGRLATNLAPALQQAGCEIVGVWSRTRASAQALATRMGGQAFWGDIDRCPSDADIYLISVTDSALPDVISQLHAGREHALFAHTAGSLPLSLFADSGHERGAVFYPMQTFSKERAVDFTQVHFFLEAAQANDYETLHSLASLLTPDDHIHPCTTALRRRLHLAAVFACNFVNHCCTLADDILQDGGLDFSVMLPLLDETVAKLHQLPPRQAQTGPAARHDRNVMGMQRAMLTDRPDLQQIYSLLSNSIMNT